MEAGEEASGWRNPVGSVAHHLGRVQALCGGGGIGVFLYSFCQDEHVSIAGEYAGDGLMFVLAGSSVVR